MKWKSKIPTTNQKSYDCSAYLTYGIFRSFSCWTYSGKVDIFSYEFKNRFCFNRLRKHLDQAIFVEIQIHLLPKYYVSSDAGTGGQWGLSRFKYCIFYIFGFEYVSK